MSDMIFNPQTRGLLEAIIERYISQIPSLIDFYKQPLPRKELMYDKETDLILGYVIGSIQANFRDCFAITYGREITIEEAMELTRILYERMPKIRKALYNVP